MIIRPVAREDFEAWLPLWRGYHVFYENPVTEAVTRATWARLLDPAESVNAFVAEDDGALLGLVHYIFHRSTWTLAPSCYLQDLFTAPAARGRGVGRRLIEAVYAAAAEAGSTRVWWLTQEGNARANGSLRPGRRALRVRAVPQADMKFEKNLSTVKSMRNLEMS